jgi:hypothetical protein
MYVYLCVFVCIGLRAREDIEDGEVFLSVYMCIYTYIFIYICIYVYIYIYIYIYIERERVKS